MAAGLAAFFLVLAVAIVPPPAPASALTRGAAARAALRALDVSGRSAPEIVYATRSPIPGGAGVRVAGPSGPAGRGADSSGEASSPSPMLARAGNAGAWLFYDDLAPFQGYEHPGRVALVDVRTGRVTLSVTIQWPPMVAGELPDFMQSSARYLSPASRVFYRPYRSAGAGARASGGSGGGLRALNEPSLPQTQAAADLLANERSCAVRYSNTLGPGLPDFDAVNQSRVRFGSLLRGLQKLNPGFRSLRYMRRRGVSPTAFIDRAISAGGCRDLLLYFAGGGFARDGSINVGLTLGSQTVRHQDVSPRELERFIAARPSTTFKIVVDAPYADRFRKRLGGLANALIVITPGANNVFAFLPDLGSGSSLPSGSGNARGLTLTNRLVCGLGAVLKIQSEVQGAGTALKAGKTRSVLAWLLARSLARCVLPDPGVAAGLTSPPVTQTHGFTPTPPPGGSGPPTPPPGGSGSPTPPPGGSGSPTPPAGHPPVAVGDTANALNTVVLDQSAAAGVLANDTDADGHPLTVTAINGGASLSGTSTAGAAVTMHADGSYSYDPRTAAALAAIPRAHSVTDTFTYTISDGHGGTASTTVTITVTGAANHPPVARADSYTASNNAVLNMTAAAGVLANDTDPDGDAVRVDQLNGSSALTGASAMGAAVTLGADGSFSYDPTGSASLKAIPRGMTATDTFNYRANDGQGGTATATATITVTGAVNHAPAAVADASTANNGAPLVQAAAAGLLANDTDADGDALAVDQLNGSTVLSGASAKGAAVTLAADGSFTYDPTGSTILAAIPRGTTTTDTFTYHVTDGHGGTATATATITVTGVINHAPVAHDETYGTDLASALKNNQATNVPRVGEHGVLFNDTDAEGDPLTVSQLGAGPGLAGTTTLGATVTIKSDGSFTYDPTTAPAGGTIRTLAIDATASDTFQYTASDGHGGAAVGSVTLLVKGANNPPTANPVSAAAVGNTLLEFGTQVTASSEPKTTITDSLDSHVSDSDPGDSARVTAVDATSTNGGIVTFDAASGGFAYRPPANFTGSDTFSYTAADTHSATATGTVTVTVANKVWYVQNNVAGGNDGRSGSPFHMLAQAQTASGAGDYIYLFSGDGTAGNQNVGIALKAGQRLIGQADDLVVGSQTLATGIPANRPQISAASGAVVTLADGVTVAGLAANPSGTAHGISGGSSVTTSATVKDLTITDSGSGDGINLTSSAPSAGITLDGVTIVVPGSGNGINVTDTTGNLAITNTSVSAGTTLTTTNQDAIMILGSAGTLTLTLTGDTIAETSANGNDALNITTANAARIDPTISATKFTAARGDLFQLNVGDTSSSRLSFMGNTLSNGNSNIVSGGGGVTITAGGGSAPAARLNFDIQHNTFRDSLGNAVIIGNNSGANTVKGTFSTNTVGVQAVANSGSAQGSDLSVAGIRGGSIGITVEHNSLYQYNNFGATFQTTGTFSLDAKVDNNTVASPGNNSGGFFGNGLQLNAGTTTGDTNAVCFDAFANKLAGSGFAPSPNVPSDIKLRQRTLTTVRLPGYPGLPETAAAYAIAQNSPPTPTALTTGSFGGGGPCTGL